MLHNARPVHSEHIRHRHLARRNVQMHKPNVRVEGLVHNRPVHAGNQVLEEGNGGCAPLRCVGRVVDVVWGDVGKVGGLRILEDVELVDEVEKDGVLLVGARVLGRAEWRLRYRGVVRCWGGE